MSPDFQPAALLIALERLLPAAASGRLIVAFSGGLDSSVLLRALVLAVRERPQFSVCAVHVDHQLHPDSLQWQRRCAEVAQALGVEYRCRRVTVAIESSGLEAAAREARYSALSDFVGAGDCLLTAHHADDQLETVLLALMRGAGAQGLCGMPACRSFSAGWHLRPLLSFSRDQLLAWATAEGLQWSTDPSNAGLRFDRNYLRHEVIPHLVQRWPAAPRAAVRSAGHLSDSNALLQDLAAADAAAAGVGDCLSVERLATLSDLRRRNALRFWLKARGARMPSTRKLLALEHDMLMAQHDRSPRVAWDGFEVRRHRGLLYAGAPRPHLGAATEVLCWNWREPLVLPAGLGRLRMEPAMASGFSAALLPAQIEVRFRSGGEQLKAAGDAHHRALKKLLHSAGVLPWWRDRIPLLHVDGKLAAVGDLWIAAELAAPPGAPALRVVWEGKPRIEAERAIR